MSSRSFYCSIRSATQTLHIQLLRFGLMIPGILQGTYSMKLVRLPTWNQVLPNDIFVPFLETRFSSKFSTNFFTINQIYTTHEAIVCTQHRRTFESLYFPSTLTVNAKLTQMVIFVIFPLTEQNLIHLIVLCQTFPLLSLIFQAHNFCSPSLFIGSNGNTCQYFCI